jgi:folate-binding protein YgfZ
MTSMTWFEDTEWSYLNVTGADRIDFFHRLTTNRVPRPGEPLLHSFFLSVNAKVLAELWLGAQDECLSLFVPTAQKQSARENIDRYHFGEKIQLHEPEGALFVLLDCPPEVLAELAGLAYDSRRPDPRYGESATWMFVAADNLEPFRDRLTALGAPLDPMQAEPLRVSTGRPRYGVDYDDETLFLEMAQQGDFSESKGCYPGQEIVARVLHRGQLRRHLRAFESEQVVPSGWSLVQQGKEMARVTTVVPWPEGGSRGFLHVRREAGDEGARLEGTGPDGQPYSLTVRPRALEVMTGDSV